MRCEILRRWRKWQHLGVCRRSAFRFGGVYFLFCAIFVSLRTWCRSALLFHFSTCHIILELMRNMYPNTSIGSKFVSECTSVKAGTCPMRHITQVQQQLSTGLVFPNVAPPHRSERCHNPASQCATTYSNLLKTETNLSKG